MAITKTRASQIELRLANLHRELSLVSNQIEEIEDRVQRGSVQHWELDLLGDLILAENGIEFDILRLEAEKKEVTA